MINIFSKHSSQIRAFRPVFLASAILAPLMLSACVSVLPEAKDAPIVYRLKVPSVTAQDLSDKITANTTVVNIEFPQSPRAFSGTDIILSPDGRRLTAAAGASWAEPVPSQIRSALIDTLAQNRKITGVIPKGGTRVPYRLNMEIRRFEAVFDNGEDQAPNAFVHINLSLTDTQSRALVGAHSISTNVRAQAVSVSAIVAAQDKATQQAMSDIDIWLTKMIRKYG